MNNVVFLDDIRRFKKIKISQEERKIIDKAMTLSIRENLNYGESKNENERLCNKS